MKKSEPVIEVKDLVKKGVVKSELIAYYLARLQQFMNGLGIPLEDIRMREHTEEEKPFYAVYAFDCEVKTSQGWVEVAANHYRTDKNKKPMDL